MKSLIVFVFVFISITAFGKGLKHKNATCCKKKTTQISKLKKDEIWMVYDETKCDNPWNFNWFTKPTEAQIIGAIKGNLEGNEINVKDIRSSIIPDFISCDACNCPNGRKIFVLVNKIDLEKLQKLKFYITKQIPANMDKVDNTK
mgnify:CR=1 FL=1